MELINTRVKSNTSVVNVHSFTEGYKDIEIYQVSAEVELVKDGSELFLDAKFEPGRDFAIAISPISSFEIDDLDGEQLNSKMREWDVIMEKQDELYFHLDDTLDFATWNALYRKKNQEYYDEVLVPGGYAEYIEKLIQLVENQIEIDGRSCQKYCDIRQQIANDGISYGGWYYSPTNHSVDDENEEDDDFINIDDLADDLIKIKGSLNYITVQTIKRALLVNSMPFYASFGDMDAIRKNISIMTNSDCLSADKIGISFKLSADKYLRGIILFVPECNNEFDALYLVISYYAHQAEFYTCELIENDIYGLRRNEDQLIKVYEKAPSIDEIWDAVDAQYEAVQKDGLYFALLHQGEEDLNSYILFDDSNPNFLRHWFGDDCRRQKIEYQNIEYYLTYSMSNGTFALMRSRKDHCANIIEEDICELPSLASFVKNTLSEIRTIEGQLLYFEKNGHNSIVIPDNVDSIRTYCVTDCSNIKQIIIPETVKLIQAKSFCNCSTLTEVFIEDNESIVIESDAFEGVLDDNIHSLRTASDDEFVAIIEEKVEELLERLGHDNHFELDEKKEMLKTINEYCTILDAYDNVPEYPKVKDLIIKATGIINRI